MKNQVVTTVDIREQEEELLEIAERTGIVLKEQNNIVIPNPRAILSIAFSYFSEMVRTLATEKPEGDESMINADGLIKIGFSSRVNEDAEKEGNLAPYIDVTNDAITLAKNAYKNKKEIDNAAGKDVTEEE